jgi:hypothetical protein
MRALRHSLTCGLALAVVVGCSSTSQPGRSTTLGEEVKGSGFLGDLYSQMKEGGDGEALRLYRNPKYATPAIFTRYKKVWLDPIQIYADPTSKLHAASKDQANLIAQSFHKQVTDHLGKDYQIVDAAGPDTLHISIAIVEAQEANTTEKAASYIPIPLGLPGAKAVAMQGITQTTGQPPFTGEISIEGKMVDSQTGEVIAAEIDRRVGARKPIIGLFESGTYDSWNDVNEAERYWAELLRYRLCMRRAAGNCVTPTE